MKLAACQESADVVDRKINKIRMCCIWYGGRSISSIFINYMGAAVILEGYIRFLGKLCEESIQHLSAYTECSCPVLYVSKNYFKFALAVACEGPAAGFPGLEFWQVA